MTFYFSIFELISMIYYILFLVFFFLLVFFLFNLFIYLKFYLDSFLFKFELKIIEKLSILEGKLEMVCMSYAARQQLSEQATLIVKQTKEASFNMWVALKYLVYSLIALYIIYIFLKYLNLWEVFYAVLIEPFLKILNVFCTQLNNWYKYIADNFGKFFTPGTDRSNETARNTLNNNNTIQINPEELPLISPPSTVVETVDPEALVSISSRRSNITSFKSETVSSISCNLKSKDGQLTNISFLGKEVENTLNSENLDNLSQEYILNSDVRAILKENCPSPVQSVQAPVPARDLVVEEPLGLSSNSLLSDNRFERYFGLTKFHNLSSQWPPNNAVPFRGLKRAESADSFFDPKQADFFNTAAELTASAANYAVKNSSKFKNFLS